MKIKNSYIYTILTSIVLLFLLVACGQSNKNADSNTDKESPLKVVTTFTILQDIAQEIGGNDVDVYNLVPTGAAPHEYEPLPTDMKKTSDADILLYYGLNLEGGKERMVFQNDQLCGTKRRKCV